jgi:hypothetical protein
MLDIEKVFELLRKANLKLTLKKCTFCKEEVEYLGHIVSKHGIKCDPKKLIAINNYPVPKDANHVRSFLGLANYYRRFVENFAEKAHPLTELTGKKVQFKWTKNEENAFALLKKSLTSPPILCYPDFTREFIIHTDASGYGVGAILGQVREKENHEEGEVVIAYYSKHLTPTQRAWCVTEREAYAIMLAVRTFRPYLYGRKFTVYTDHKPLEWLMNIKTPNSRLMRWSMEIQEYDIAIGYKPGKTHQNADCLSRVPINHISVTQEWNKMQQEDPFCEFAKSTIEKADGIFNPTVENLQAPTATGTVENSTVAVQRDEAAPKIKKRRQKFTLLPGDLVGTKKGQIIVPKSKIKDVLHRYHDHKLAGHLGVTKTLMRIKAKFFWPKMEKDIVEYVTTCAICQKRKAYSNTRAPLQPIPIVNRL